MFTELPPGLMQSLLVVLGVGGAIWSFAWWLSGRFDAFSEKIDRVGAMIMEKLEYHERHDDARFGSVSDDLWQLRLRNAKIDGEELNKQRTK